jgi:predicted small metal-binding protein
METMKTMTCSQLGGPCDLKFRGDNADVVIKSQDRHLRDAVQVGDTTHKPAHDEMKKRWRRPLAAMGWYRDTKKAFSELPED